ncbi:MAG: hypothetical protein QTN59_04210 [Candidatus Electrothrix communis]|nr:MAG: hypothetical protein QTN59_04210 [Candidatus Electrothrix communis]
MTETVRFSGETAGLLSSMDKEKLQTAWNNAGNGNNFIPLSITGANTNNTIAKEQSLEVFKFLNNTHRVTNIEQVTIKTFLKPCWGITVLFPLLVEQPVEPR